MSEIQNKPIVILVLDDHALFREGVARLLQAEPGFEVVPAGTIDEALATLRRKRFDIVLLDFDLGADDGTNFLRLARQQGFDGKALVVTAGVFQEEAAALLQAGVSGIVMKHESATSLGEGIRNVMAGKVWFSEDMLQRAMEVKAKRLRPPAAPQFTHRERQVLSGVYQGLANKEIAANLAVTESAVKGILQQLFAKTGTHSRSQLVRLTLERYRDQI
jgi:two-component system, NarL family, nitrate/nitrite response regulator NarL